MCSRPFETRFLPKSLAASLAVLPSMSLFPKAPFDLGLPIYVARAPAAPFVRFPTSLAGYPSRLCLLCRFPKQLHFLARQAGLSFYARHDVASVKAGRSDPTRSIRALVLSIVAWIYRHKRMVPRTERERLAARRKKKLRDRVETSTQEGKREVRDHEE